MQKVSQLLGAPEPKKHSVRYNAIKGVEPSPLTAVYISRKFLGSPAPDTVLITIEDGNAE